MKLPDQRLISQVKARLLLLSDLPLWMSEALSMVGQSSKFGTGEDSLQIETKPVTESYLDFLDLQIQLEPRGKEHADLLQQRRNALAKHRGNMCLDVTVTDGKHFFFVWMTSDGLNVIWHDPFGAYDGVM